MTTTNQIELQVAEVEPHEPTAWVPVSPADLTADCLESLQIASEGLGVLREWLKERVLRELGRREANLADTTPVEAESWSLPWHTWTDGQIADSLAISASWLHVNLGPEVANVYDHLHR